MAALADPPLVEVRRDGDRSLGVAFVAMVALLVVAIAASVFFLIRQAREIASKTAIFEVTLDTMVQGVVLQLPDGSLPLVNRRACELLDVPPELIASGAKFQEIFEYLRRKGEFDNLDPEEFARVQRQAANPSSSRMPCLPSSIRLRYGYRRC